MARFKTIAGPSGSTQVAFTDEEEAAKDAEELKWNNTVSARKWATIREKRDALLAACDWMATSDLTMTDAWKAYRQALRDVPSTESDVDNITWPTEPG